MRMNSLILLAAATILVAGVSWSRAQQQPSTNEMIVEASRLIRSAESAPTPEQAISLLEKAHRKLVLITEVHPSSDLAVRLATGQGIGTVSLAGVQAAIKAATEKCWTLLSLLCVARLTFEAAMSEDKTSDNNALSYQRIESLAAIATAQGQAGQFSVAVETVALMDSAAALGDDRRAADYHAAYSRAEALVAIAAAQRQANQADEAQRPQRQDSRRRRSGRRILPGSTPETSRICSGRNRAV